MAWIRNPPTKPGRYWYATLESDGKWIVHGPVSVDVDERGPHSGQCFGSLNYLSSAEDVRWWDRPVRQPAPPRPSPIANNIEG